MSATDEDRERAVSLIPDHQSWRFTASHGDCCGADDNNCECGVAESRSAVAQALADERERTLASCYGRHEALSLPVAAPGLVTCDGHELRWTAP